MKWLLFAALLLGGCRLGSCIDGGASNREGCVKRHSSWLCVEDGGGYELCVEDGGGYELWSDGVFGSAVACIPAPAQYQDGAQ